jgi:hypothetical protein
MTLPSLSIPCPSVLSAIPELMDVFVLTRIDIGTKVIGKHYTSDEVHALYP